MPDIEILAVLVATVAAFIFSGGYYALMGDRLAAVSSAAASGETQSPWTLAVEVLRSLVLATVVAGLAAQGEIDAIGEGVLLGLALWIGFPLVLWVGAIVHEKTPWRLAAIHAGDWLLKLLVVGAIVAGLQ